MKPKLQKILLISVILSLLLLGGGYGGYRVYKNMRQAKLVKQAQKYLDKSEPRKAMLVLQRALRYNSRDVEACRLMADLAEAGRSPVALMWRSRVVEYNPLSNDDRLALARTAMTFRDYAAATNALEGVDLPGKKTASYHNIAGTVAAAGNRADQAEAHFLEAARLEPQNPVLQLNLSVTRLHRTNAQGLLEARSTLKQVSANPTNSMLRCQALRELIVDSMRYRQAETALTLSQQLLRETNSTFQDRILRLNVLRATTNAQFKTALASFQREAVTNSATIYEMGMWQLANTTPAETLTWLRTVPISEQTNQPAALLMAECFTALKDWPGLQNFLEPQNWAELEFIRRAFKARALRGQNLTGAAKSEWEVALKAVNGQQAGLVMLLRLAAAWNWQSEGEELLWSIVNRYPAEKWAFNALNQILYVGGRTRPMMTLYIQELKRTPTDLAMKNNLAVTALLLEANEQKPHDLALEVYQKAPTNSSYASTYAFSLHLLGKNAEALKVMQSINAKDLEDPSIASYYGLILKATGDAAKARPYLEKSTKAQLLPEERLLFDRAKAGK